MSTQTRTRQRSTQSGRRFAKSGAAPRGHAAPPPPGGRDPLAVTQAQAAEVGHDDRRSRRSPASSAARRRPAAPPRAPRPGPAWPCSRRPRGSRSRTATSSPRCSTAAAARPTRRVGAAARHHGRPGPCRDGGRHDGAADRRAARRHDELEQAERAAEGGAVDRIAASVRGPARRSQLRELRKLQLEEPSAEGRPAHVAVGERRRAPGRLRLRDRRRRALPRRLRALRRRRAGHAAPRAGRRAAARPRRARRGQARPRGRSPCCRPSAATRSARCSGSDRAPARGATAASCGRWRSTARCAARPARSTSRRSTSAWRDHIEHLNIEGASVLGDRLWLLQRGGGTAEAAGIVAELSLDKVMESLRDDLRIDPHELAALRAYDLGTLDGVPAHVQRRDARGAGAARLHRVRRGRGRRHPRLASWARSTATATSSGCGRSTAATRSRACTPRSTPASWTSSSCATRTTRTRRRRCSGAAMPVDGALERDG